MEDIIQQQDTTLQEDVTEQVDAIQQEDTTEQVDATQQEDVTQQDDGTQRAEFTQQEDTSQHEDATQAEGITQREDIAQKEESTHKEQTRKQEHADTELTDNEEFKSFLEKEQTEDHEEIREEGDTHEDIEAERIYVQEEQEKDEKISVKDKEKVFVGSEEIVSEKPGDQLEGDQEELKAKEEQKPLEEELVQDEDVYVEEPPPDPAAPFDFSDSKEAMKEPFELRPEQLAEVEQLWELYQNYTPVYTDIDGYITEKELVYMLKSLFLMTFTPDQLQELIAFCVRPPHPEGHIIYEQFLKMVTIRQRDLTIEDELRSALQIFDPDKSGSMDREYIKEALAKQGNKMPQKQLDNLIKEVDMSNDGTIGIEDVIGTMCIDLNKEDLIMLRDAIFPPEVHPPSVEEL